MSLEMFKVAYTAFVFALSCLIAYFFKFDIAAGMAFMALVLASRTTAENMWFLAYMKKHLTPMEETNESSRKSE